MSGRRRQAGVGYALGEGWRNAWASRLLGVLATVLSACVLGGVAVADALVVADIAANERTWIAAGGHVLVVSNEDGLSARSCERLNNAEGVRAAVGLVRVHQRAALSSAPHATLAVTGFTAGLTRFLDSAVPLDRVVIDDGTAADYGLTDGQRLGLTFSWVDEGQPSPQTPGLSTGDPAVRRAPAVTRLLAVADLAILGEEYSAGVALPIAASGLVNTCMVWADAGAKSVLRSSLPSVLPGGGDKPTVVDDRLISGQFARDYHDEYLSRSWRWVPLAGGAALGLIWILIRWIRRSEDGLYQSLGTPTAHRALLRLIEWMLYCLAGVTLAYLGALLALLLLRPGANMQPHLLRSLALGLAAAITTAALAALLPARNPLEALKDR